MNGRLYLKNKLLILLFNLLSMLGLSIFLLISGTNLDTVLFLALIWFLVFIGYMIISYKSRKKQMESLLHLAEELKEGYLIAEIMEQPERADDQVFFQILKIAEKSMLERIGAVQRERMEYKEYIEQWIHEIKTPITAMNLICENHRSTFTKELLVEIEKTNRFTEQALYYARSEHTEKDYSVREIHIFDVVHQSIADNKYLLLQNSVGIDIEDSDGVVYSDDKWLRFILNQLIVNSVKYRTEQPMLRFHSEHQGNQLLLYIEDNGIGISASDLPRIFEKGFTGKNGRANENSTGIGLYLCKRLCDKLEIGITASSKGVGTGTSICLSFYVNDFIRQVQG